MAKEKVLSKKELAKKYRREVALHYASAREIELADKPKDKELVDAIDKFMRKELKGRKEGDKFTCLVSSGGCGHYILDDDLFCWFCGDDVSEKGDSGGFDKVVGVSKTKEEPEAEPEAEEAEAEPESEEPAEEAEPEEPAEAVESDEDVHLDDCTERILTLSRNSGTNAFDIGFELHRVQVTNAYKQGKHKTFDDYCKKMLGMERASAYNYIRINKAFVREEIGGLTYEKLLILTRIKDDKERSKQLKAAKPKSEGGKGLTRTDLREKIKSMPKTSKTEGKSTGRPPLPRYRSFVGDQFRGEWADKKQNTMIIEDAEVFGAGVGLEVKVLKTGRNGSLKFEVIELEE